MSINFLCKNKEFLAKRQLKTRNQLKNCELKPFKTSTTTPPQMFLIKKKGVVAVHMYGENCANNLGDNEVFFCEQCGRAIRQEHHLTQQDVIFFAI